MDAFKEAQKRLRSGIWSPDSIHDPSGAIPMWLDVDTGHDDAYALLLAAHCPKISLIGVSTVHGNAGIDNTTDNTLSILEAIGCAHIPVYPGARKPFCREAVHAEDIHGESGLDGTALLPKPTSGPQKGGIPAIYEHLIKTPPKTAWIVATGACTNVALLLAVYPHLADHIAGVSLMGGAVGFGFTDAPMGTLEDRLKHTYEQTPFGKEYYQACEDGKTAPFGNWTPWAEFNIFIDPEAAAAIFENPSLQGRILLTPLDLSHNVLATPEVCTTIRYGSTNQPKNISDTLSHAPVRELFHDIVTYFADTYRTVFGMGSPPMHDPVTVFLILATVLDHKLAPDVEDPDHRFGIFVHCDGDREINNPKRKGPTTGNCGRTILTRGNGGVVIPRNIDTDMFWAMIDLCLETAEQVSPMKFDTA